MNPPPPVLIVGSPRSGTTLLSRLVNKFLDIHVARDGGVLLEFYRMRRAYGDLGDVRNLRTLVRDLYANGTFRTRLLTRGLTFSSSELLSAVDRPTYAGVVEAVLSETARSHGKRGWGNKRPDYAFLSRHEIDALFPDAKVVQIVRDGRDVVLSMRRAGHLLVEKNWYFAACDWRDHFLASRRLRSELGDSRYLEIRYEELLEDPLKTLSALMQFAECSTGPQWTRAQMRREILATIKRGNTNKWKTQMLPHSVSIVERVAGNELEEAGYELFDPDLAERGIGGLERLAYNCDRVYRNLFHRNLRKLVLRKSETARSWIRAAAGRMIRG